MAMTEKPPILYILMRTDLYSLNSGKAMAQACHAANFAVSESKVGSDTARLLVAEWETQTSQDFGTTIVLDGGSINDIVNILEEIAAKSFISSDYVSYGVVFDPTYPVRDGDVTHLIPLDTCAFVFCRTDDSAAKILSRLDLHP